MYNPNKRELWILLIMTATLFVWMTSHLSSVQDRITKQAANNGASHLPQAERVQHSEVLDTRITGYSQEEARLFFESIGRFAREVTYRNTESTTDMLYPIVYTIMNMCLLLLLLRRDTWYRSVVLVGGIVFATGAAFFDYVENFVILNMIDSYPDMTIHAGVLTPLKWLFVFTFDAILIVLGFIRFVQFVRWIWRKPAPTQEA